MRRPACSAHLGWRGGCSAACLSAGRSGWRYSVRCMAASATRSRTLRPTVRRPQTSSKTSAQPGPASPTTTSRRSSGSSASLWPAMPCKRCYGCAPKRPAAASRRCCPPVVSRPRWMGSHILITVLGTALILALAGLATGLTYGLVIHDVGGQAPKLTWAAVVQAPAVFVIAGFVGPLWPTPPARCRARLGRLHPGAARRSVRRAVRVAGVGAQPLAVLAAAVGPARRRDRWPVAAPACCGGRAGCPWRHRLPAARPRPVLKIVATRRPSVAMRPRWADATSRILVSTRSPSLRPHTPRLESGHDRDEHEQGDPSCIPTDLDRFIGALSAFPVGDTLRANSSTPRGRTSMPSSPIITRASTRSLARASSRSA